MTMIAIMMRKAQNPFGPLLHRRFPRCRCSHQIIASTPVGRRGWNRDGFISRMEVREMGSGMGIASHDITRSKKRSKGSDLIKRKGSIGRKHHSKPNNDTIQQHNTKRSVRGTEKTTAMMLLRISHLQPSKALMQKSTILHKHITATLPTPTIIQLIQLHHPPPTMPSPRSTSNPHHPSQRQQLPSAALPYSPPTHPPPLLKRHLRLPLA
mmetsp:Transcript_5745/g.12510  ORF Transcript_5745/g.12510 Transcript_5745/m.12510 type:complete len:210 (-) Transcript_5745:900-1529(-)